MSDGFSSSVASWRQRWVSVIDADLTGLVSIEVLGFCPRTIFIRLCAHAGAFVALTLLVGRQEEHPACKNSAMRCWCSYLSGTRCRLFAYGSADVTTSQNPTILCVV